MQERSVFANIARRYLGIVDVLAAISVPFRLLHSEPRFELPRLQEIDTGQLNAAIDRKNPIHLAVFCQDHRIEMMVG